MDGAAGTALMTTAADGGGLARIGNPSRHPAAVYLASLREGPSRRTMLQSLNLAAGLLTDGRQDAESLEWAAVRYQHVQALRSVLQTEKAPATANKVLSAVRSVLREAFSLGLMSGEDYHKARSVRAVKGSRPPAGRSLSKRELQRLFQVCAADPSPAGARDAALVAVLYGAGLRRSEAAGLAVADYSPETGALSIREGKGGKARTVYASAGCRQALTAWLRIRGMASGALFVPISRTGKVELRGVTDQALYKTLAKRAGEAGLARFSPHDLRRTFVGDLLDAGADISAVQQLAGHASVTTTARYDRRGERAKQQAAELLHVPFGE